MGTFGDLLKNNADILDKLSRERTQEVTTMEQKKEKKQTVLEPVPEMAPLLTTEEVDMLLDACNVHDITKEDTKMNEEKKELPIQKLVADGILTEEEAQQFKQEHKEDTTMSEPILTRDEVAGLVEGIDEAPTPGNSDTFYPGNDPLPNELQDALNRTAFSMQINLIGNMVKDKKGLAAEAILAACLASRDANAKNILCGIHIETLNGLMLEWCKLYDAGGECLSDDPRRGAFEELYMKVCRYTYELSTDMGMTVDEPVLPKRVSNVKSTTQVPTEVQPSKEDTQVNTTDARNTRPIGERIGRVTGKGTEAIITGTVVASKFTGKVVAHDVAPAIGKAAKSTWKTLRDIASGAKQGYLDGKNKR